MRILLTSAAWLVIFPCHVTHADQELFPFVVTYDAPENATNISGWTERPAGKHGFVRQENGHLATDAGPIRFWGTNLCFQACFPDKDEAERLAARLARLGINCVRLHHMDDAAIWGDSPNKTIIDPKQLDRLDYLIHQLKQYGIYTNLNLHVSRWLGPAEGFPNPELRPNYDKGVDNFEPRMIALQKQYARDLLTHVNPYTHTVYVEEPAVAFVEISNEDALFAVWHWGQLDKLPDPYAAVLQQLWNEWLLKKYRDTDSLRAAWNGGAREQLGDRKAEAQQRPGDLPPEQKLEDLSVVIVRRHSPHTPAGEDFCDFLWELERQYWQEMYRFLKDELKVRSLVCGTQLGYSPVHVQAESDYIDNHSYWQHPEFPNRPWDPRDWFINDTALVNSPGGTLAHLASGRVDGKPYTISEYNHPAPNSYAAEGFPMIAAFGAFQNWDGVYSYSYSHDKRYELQLIERFFDIKSHPGHLVHMPACVAMFRRGDVSPSKNPKTFRFTAEDERQLLYQTRNPWALTAEPLRRDIQYSLLYGTALDLVDRVEGRPNDSPPTGEGTAALEAGRFCSDTGEIQWDISQRDAGFFTVDTPRSKLFTGFVRGRTFSLGNVTLEIGPTRLDWATVSMVALNGDGFDQPGRVLIAATGWMQNTGAELEQLGERRITLRDRWGGEPVLCEGIHACVVLPVAAERVRFYPLDESGHRRQAIAVVNRNDRAEILLSPDNRTLWYEAEIIAP